uniref:Ras-GEF domain-containing protein n=1 Tax=Syphacia muris TaxID=451379 RepID=A0A0N5AM45_9BILA
MDHPFKVIRASRKHQIVNVGVAMLNNTISLDDRLVLSLSDLEDLCIDDDKNKPSFCNKDYDPVTFQMLKVKPSDFANQITLIDIDVFKSITSQELLSGNWSKKNKRTLAPNVMRFTDRFNCVCLWCQKEILAYDKPSKRAGVIAHFIKIIMFQHLTMLKNLHSTFAIISALQSHPIHRLKKTWECLSRRDGNTFQRLAALFDSYRNWEKLRKYLEDSTLPCMPYLGMFLTDLNFIEAKNSDNKDLLNADAKHSELEDILRKIRWFQHSSYSHIPRIECIQKYLASIQHHEELIKFVEDDIYKQSLLCEPDEKSFSLECSFGRPSSELKAATISRIHLRHKGENDEIKLKSAFHDLTFQQENQLMNGKKNSAGHRKTQSFDAQAVLKLRGHTSPFQRNVDDNSVRNATVNNTKDAALSSVFYVDAADNKTEGFECFVSDDTCDSKPSSSFQSGLMDSLVYGQSSAASLFSNNIEKNNSVTCVHKGMDGKPPIIWQGEVRKIVVRTRGSRPAKLKCSRKCYLELYGQTLSQYEHRALAINCKRVRDHYKKKKSKRMMLGGDNWKVIGPQCSEDISFELHHPATGNCYIFIIFVLVIVYIAYY